MPLGVRALQRLTNKCCPEKSFNRNLWYRSSILVLTFLAYTCYHTSRKPISVVKNVFNRNCSEIHPPHSLSDDVNNSTWCDWAPFNTKDASALLGTLDSSFLFAYAAAMFVSGFVAERVSLRYFLAFGMILSGVSSYLLGLAHTYEIHSLPYFIVVQIFGGIVQTTGWPGVVAVMGNWFGKAKRGFIFGVWNSHTSIGNILGSLIAGYFLEENWGLSFMVPGAIIASMGVVIFFCLVPNPADVGCVTPEQNRPEIKDKVTVNSRYERVPDNSDGEDETFTETDAVTSTEDEVASEEDSLRKPDTEVRPILIPDTVPKAVGFIGALKIPGVIEFSLCLFFAKLVSYTFLYWLPLYIKSSTTLSATLSADLSTVFDVGGIAGGIAAGVISDYSGMSATTCAAMLSIAVPVLFVYNLFGAETLGINILLLVVAGILVNGPYALITTAVSAELGTHHSLSGNSKALATVTAIIDGTGSVGAAVGPLLAGVVSAYGWQNVFYMLMAADVFAMLLLTRLVKHEISRLRRPPVANGPWQA